MSTTIAQRKEQILQCLAQALDQCVIAQEEFRSGAEVLRFEAELTFRFSNEVVLRSAPQLDLTLPILPQMEQKSLV
jgi:hypothetical protein